MHRRMSRARGGQRQVGAWGPLARMRRGWGWGLVVASLLWCGVPQVGLGAPGDLDLTFGTGGIVTSDFGGFGYLAALVLQADGKLVAAGQASVSADSDSSLTLARYQPDGSLDPSFGTGGMVTTEGHVSVSALVLQPDGKRVVAGTATTSSSAYSFLIRYDPAGSLDPTFGTGGIVTLALEGGSGLNALIRQPDGKLVMAGYAGACQYCFPYAHIVLVRFQPDGSLDPTFGTDGIVRLECEAEGGCSASALVLQPDGRLVAAARTYTPDVNVALARYQPDGSLDPSFGTGGIVTTDFGADDSLHALVLQPDGRLVAAGSTYDPSRSTGNFALARYQPDGSPDPSFGTGGIVTTDLGTTDGFNALVLQPDGRLVAAGWSNISSSQGQEFALARYQTAEGCLGTGAFQLQGRVKTGTGLAGMAGVPLLLSGPNACRDTTSSRVFGLYHFPSLNEGLYTVTPSHAGCTFSPPSQTVTIAGGDAGANFTADCP